MTHHFILLRQSQYLMVIEDGGLSTLCDSCRFICQQSVLKTFPGPDYLWSDDRIV